MSCYLSKLLGELQQDPTLAKKFNAFGSQMSATRAALRLFDDIPTLKRNLEYGFGGNVKHFFSILYIKNSLLPKIKQHYILMFLINNSFLYLVFKLGLILY